MPHLRPQVTSAEMYDGMLPAPGAPPIVRFTTSSGSRSRAGDPLGTREEETTMLQTLELTS
jgi:hypothetical protein